MKIEFYERSNKLGGPPSKKLETHNSKTLKECRTMHNDGFIAINSEMSVGDLILHFNDVYGQAIDVFKNQPIIYGTNSRHSKNPFYQK